MNMMYTWACVVLILAAVAAEERQPRLFDANFWRQLERGFERVAGDLEVAVDQLGTSISNPRPNNRISFSDRLDQQVQNALPPWMRAPNRQTDEGHEIQAIEGSLSGVDDGLTVFYDDDEVVKIHSKDRNGSSEGVIAVEVENVGHPEAETHHVELKKEPPQTVFDRVPLQSTNNNRQPSNPLGSSIFTRLFKPFSLGGSIGGRPWSASSFTPWWKRDNVCVDREEVDDGETDLTSSSNPKSFFFFSTETSYCSESDDMYTCVTTTTSRGMKKTLTVTYRCCHGYAKEAGTECQKVEKRTLDELMDDMGTTFFQSIVRSADVFSIIDNDNLTLFVPSNEAIQEYTIELEILNESNDILELEGLDGERQREGANNYRTKRSHDMSDIIKAHIVPDFVYASDFKDEGILKTKMEGATIRINTYSGSPTVVTANCARIVTANQRATNGVIHTTDRVVPPVTKNIIEMLAGNPQYTILNQLLNNEAASSTLEKLRNDGQFTFFAPTDDAFANLPENTLTAMLEANVCLDSILKNHILPNVICSAALGPKSRTINLLEDYLVLENNDDGRLHVQDAEVLEKDIMATNGVIYAIDQPLIPTEAMPLIDVLSSRNLTKFIDLLETAELMEELAKMSDVTVFAPSNDAIEEMAEDVMEDLMNDKESLKTLLRYHITSSALHGSDMTNNHMVETRAGHPIRMNLYNSFPLLSHQTHQAPVRVTAGCSRVSQMDNRACGGVVHVIEQVLEVPNESIMERLQKEETYSIFNQIINDVGLAKELSEGGTYTVLAPSDYVFKALPQEELDMILADEAMKESLAKKHILKEHICCSGINTNTWLFMDNKRTMEGGSLHVRRTHNGRLMAGPARITDCGSPAKNGVVHTVNHILHDIRPQNNRNNGFKLNFNTPGLDVYFGF